MKFLCNLSARRCNVGLPLEQSRDGDEIVLQVPERQQDLGERIADSLRTHISSSGKAVAVNLEILHPALVEPGAAQRLAQRA